MVLHWILPISLPQLHSVTFQNVYTAPYKQKQTSAHYHWNHCTELLYWMSLIEFTIVTFRYPVRRSKFRCRFLISPNSANLSWMSSSVASSCTPVTNRIQPSTATMTITNSSSSHSRWILTKTTPTSKPLQVPRPLQHSEDREIWTTLPS